MSAANNHENKNGEEEEKSPYLLEFQVLHDLGQKPFEKIIKATLYNDRDKLLQISRKCQKSNQKPTKKSSTKSQILKRSKDRA